MVYNDVQNLLEFKGKQLSDFAYFLYKFMPQRNLILRIKD